MSLKNDIERYQAERQPNLDAVKKHYSAKTLTLSDAIQQASKGMNPDGRMNSHQWRVGKKKGEIGANELLKKEQEIENCISFEEIFEITESVRYKLKGLGDLWSYDTALRIGFNKGVLPKEIYIQAGVVRGVKKLLGNNFKIKRHLPSSDFPNEIRALEPYVAENFLCVWGKNTNSHLKHYLYRLNFVTAEKTTLFKLESESLERIEEILSDLLPIFATGTRDNLPVIEGPFTANQEIISQIAHLVEKYNKRLPQINNINSFLKKLELDEEFFFLPGINLSDHQRLELHDLLLASKQKVPFEELHEKSLDLFGDLINKYEVDSYGNIRVNIGQKINPICRFCKNKRENLTFKKKAHAISEGLGNKKVVLFEECDGCNDEFGRQIEPDIINYLSFNRTLHDVKGKGGTKQFKGKNFTLKKEQEIVLTFDKSVQRPELFKMPYVARLEANTIVLQNIYKCLCKYFLSVIDTSQVQKFDKTISWLNGEFVAERLPEIAEIVSYEGFCEEPKIRTFIRKDEDDTLPYAVGEFQFTFWKFVFVIPFANSEKTTFSEKIDYNRFRNFFRMYSSVNGWTFKDYSDTKRKDLTMILNFELATNEDIAGKNHLQPLE